MAKNTSILLEDHSKNFINNEITSGRYNSTSKVIRTVLRLFKLKEQKTKQLCKEPELGEKGAMVENFNLKNLIIYITNLVTRTNRSIAHLCTI